MSSASFFVSPQELWASIGTADAPMILAARRREIYEAGPGVIPTAQWHKPETFMEWVPSLPTDRPIVLAVALWAQSEPDDCGRAARARRVRAGAGRRAQRVE